MFERGAGVAGVAQMGEKPLLPLQKTRRQFHEALKELELLLDLHQLLQAGGFLFQVFLQVCPPDIFHGKKWFTFFICFKVP